MRAQWLSYILLFATPWTVARLAPLSMGFPRQEYWSGLPFPSPGDLPDPGIEPESPPLQVGSLLLSRQGSPRKLATLPQVFGGERGGCGLGQDLWVLSPASPLPGVKDATQGREEGFS